MRMLMTLMLAVALAGCIDEPASVMPRQTMEYLHPVFHTPVSVGAATRPAVQVDVLDDHEGWFTTAELYLAVQSSRFPGDTWVVLPLNQGDFDGAGKRFVELPFEEVGRVLVGRATKTGHHADVGQALLVDHVHDHDGGVRRIEGGAGRLGHA